MTDRFSPSSFFFLRASTTDRINLRAIFVFTLLRVKRYVCFGWLPVRADRETRSIGPKDNITGL